MRKLKKWLCEWLRRHVALYHHVQECAHLVYFGLVAAHGPYELAAGGLLILGLGAFLLATVNGHAQA